MNLAIVFAAFLAIGTTSIPAASAQAQGQQGPLRSRALQTPDGTPPAFESVCDTYKDEEEPYGICVALCEAQDCGSTTSCEALKTNWLELTDEELPCELTTTTTSTGTTTTTTTTDAPGLTCNYSCCTSTGCLDLDQDRADCGSGSDSDGECGEGAKDSACWEVAAKLCLLNNGSFQGNKSCQELAAENNKPNGNAVCKSGGLTTTPTRTPTDARGEICSYSCCTSTGCKDLTQTGCNGGCDRDSDEDCWNSASAFCLQPIFQGNTKVLGGAAAPNDYGSFQGNKSCQELADENNKPNGDVVCKAADTCWFTYCSDEFPGIAQCAKTECPRCSDRECTDIATNAIQAVQTSAGYTNVTVKRSNTNFCVTALVKEIKKCPATTTAAP